MSKLNSGVSVSDIPSILSSGITKIKENSSQQTQPKMNNNNPGKFSSQPNQPASSLDYLYQAISLIETKNNQANSFYLNQGLNNSNPNKQCGGISNVANAHQNILKQQNLMANSLNNSDQNRYAGQFISPTEQFNQFYNLNGQHNLNHSQFSMVDSRRYLNNLMLQQQHLQKAQQQQLQQNSLNCTDPYCNCNESTMNKNLTANKLNTINNLIGHQQHQQQQQSFQLSSISSSNNFNHKPSKSPPSKIIKQRRNEERNERRISNLIQLSKSQLSTLQNKKNISKKNISICASPVRLYQVNSMSNSEFPTLSDKNLLSKKATPSRLEKAKQLARKQQNTLKLNLASTDAQMIEHEGLLTPISASSSISPQSVQANSPLSSASPMSCQFSPKVSQLPQTTQNSNSTNTPLQQNKFNFYPVEIMNSLIPLYLTPYLNNINQSNGCNLNQSTAPITLPPNENQYQLPNQLHAPTNGPANNIDQFYFQNLVTAIYTIANYQQQQQQQNAQNNSQMIIPNATLNSNNNKSNHVNEITFNSTANITNCQKLGQNPVQLLLNQNYLNAHNSSGFPEKIDKQKSIPLTPIASQVQKKVETKCDDSAQLSPEPSIKRKSTSKIISYIGTDIDGKVHEHFRRSLGTKYLKILNKLNNKISSSSISESSVSDGEPEKLNEVVQETINCTGDKNMEKEAWLTDVNNNNIDEFCECSNFECTQNHKENSLNTSNADSNNYDELTGYDTEENLVDSLNADTIPSNPSTPVSNASFSYSVTSQNIANDECNENDDDDDDLNDFEDMIDSIEGNSLPNLLVPSSQLIS